MKAMILAAGFGARMRELTKDTPKPLLKVSENSLIEHHLLNLKQAGFSDIIINVSYLGDQIMQTLGDGSRYQMHIRYSQEVEPLEWGGGILQALPLLGKEPFMVLSADLWTNFPFHSLRQYANQLSTSHVAHLVLAKDPSCRDDFSLDEAGKVTKENPRYTYAGIGVIHPQLFDGYAPGKHSCSKILLPVVEQKKVTGEVYPGVWVNVGTPEDLVAIRNLPTRKVT
jgi:MurNAc alpha-1-phosphate uridylyltransferase